MSLSLPPWRERPLERGDRGEGGNGSLLDALVEAWNRELSQLLLALRRFAFETVGVTVKISFSESPHTLLPSTKFLRVDATGGEVIVNLRPSTEALNEGVQFFIIKKLDPSANAVVITAVGDDDIEDAATAPLTSQFEAVDVRVRDGGYDIT